MQHILNDDGNTGKIHAVRSLHKGPALFAFIAVLWLGLVLGVSFLATPVKFQAPTLDLIAALDVGRVTFALFSKIEWPLCATLIVAAAISPPLRRWSLTGATILAMLLFIQTIWLLPVLMERVSHIVAGATVSSTHHHLFYVLFEAAKALLLITLAVGALAKITAPFGHEGQA